MPALIPPELMFHCTFPVQRIDALPRRGQRLLNLPEECRLPSLAEMSDRRQFADLRLAWNDNGFAVSVAVEGKTAPPSCDPEHPGQSDGLWFWIDTRNTQSIHRASRFCHQFELLPTGGDEDGNAPVIIPRPIARAKEEAPLTDPDAIPIQSSITGTGYWLEAWIPAIVLHGYDPQRQSKIGFYYAVHDLQLGTQTLSLGPEFPFGNDPSLWSTLDLVTPQDK